MTATRPVYLPTIRDAVLSHLDTPRNYALLRQRLATHGLVAYQMAVRDACPECAFEEEVAEPVRDAIRARRPRMVRRARRAA